MLPANTRLGQVHLTVSDLKRALTFYERALGFQIHKHEGGYAVLGAGQVDFLALTENPEATKLPRSAGLYHFAVLVPSRLDLAYSLKNLIDSGIRLTGGADHLVSEALYLDDPDGNGIEIYRDRPRETWQTEDGQLIMGTEALDYHGILAEMGDSLKPWTGLNPETVLGHMHLHVSYLEEATSFYKDLVGFDLMTSLWGSASFLSFGGYHHHLGLNVWNGVGAPPTPPNSIGLRYFTVHLPGQQALEGLNQRLGKAGIPVNDYKSGIFVRDPSQNGIVFTASD